MIGTSCYIRVYAHLMTINKKVNNFGISRAYVIEKILKNLKKNTRIYHIDFIKKNFLILAIIVGFIGLALGGYTMFLSINDIIKP